MDAPCHFLSCADTVPACRHRIGAVVACRHAAGLCACYRACPHAPLRRAPDAGRAPGDVVRLATGARVVVVEGEIGAGKSTLVRALAAELERRGLAVCPVYEPVELWHAAGILQKFYADPARWAYAFQSFAFATRCVAILDAVRARPLADVYLLERSPATDRVFMALSAELVDPVELAMYRAWCDLHERLLPLDLAAATALYLKPSLAVCMRRLAARARAGEAARPADAADAVGAGGPGDGSAAGGVTLQYQARLRRAHEALLQGRSPGPTGEFLALVGLRAPFAAAVEAGPELADCDFVTPGPERERVVAAILARLGFGA